MSVRKHVGKLLLGDFDVVVFCGRAAFALSAELGGSPASAAELIPFRVGEAAPANTFLAIWMAEAAGFYEARG